MKKKTEQKRRFPRFPKGDDVGRVAKRIWKRTQFTVRQGQNLTEFIFFVDFNIPRKIKKTEPSVYLQLFGPERSSFKRVLKQAWRRGLYGQERIRDLVDRSLFTVVLPSKLDVQGLRV